MIDPTKNAHIPVRTPDGDGLIEKIEITKLGHVYLTVKHADGMCIHYYWGNVSELIDLDGWEVMMDTTGVSTYRELQPKKEEF
jgi:hypothetical protein